MKLGSFVMKGQPLREDAGARPRFCLRWNERNVDVSARGLVIGRALECDLVLLGGLVSRVHARVAETKDGLVVEDLRSKNGVMVNDRRISAPTALVHGDVIAIGIDRFEVVDTSVAERPAHLSTLPPPPVSVTRGRVPPGEADVDAPPETTVRARLAVLSDREQEVLELIVLGYTQREIAQQLFVSVKTVESHRAHIAEKLGARTRAELVTYAISAGLLRALVR